MLYSFIFPFGNERRYGIIYLLDLIRPYLSPVLRELIIKKFKSFYLITISIKTQTKKSLFVGFFFVQRINKKKRIHFNEKRKKNNVISHD